MNTPVPRTCSTCAHRVGSFAWGRCAASGMYIEVERKHPMVCGRKFETWSPRQGLLTRIRQFFVGAGKEARPEQQEPDYKTLLQQEPDYKALFEQMSQLHDILVDKLKAAQQALKPLTDKEINDVYGVANVQWTHIPHDDVVRIVRATEAAHGIGENK
jgi:hypothetical protein